MRESWQERINRERVARIPGLADAQERTRQRQKDLRRTRLHYFGLAGGRRSK